MRWASPWKSFQNTCKGAPYENEPRYPICPDCQESLVTQDSLHVCPGCGLTFNVEPQLSRQHGSLTTRLVRIAEILARAFDLPERMGTAARAENVISQSNTRTAMPSGHTAMTR